jgi:hypothetical protein
LIDVYTSNDNILKLLNDVVSIAEVRIASNGMGKDGHGIFTRFPCSG